MKITKKQIPLFALGGLAAGFFNGLLGAGGGVAVIYVLKKLSHGGKPQKNWVFANAPATVLPAAVLSSARYFSAGALPTDTALKLILPALLGGICGALLLNKLHANTVRILFSLILIYSGIAMLVKQSGGI